jgi:hypothetical protein
MPITRAKIPAEAHFDATIEELVEVSLRTLKRLWIVRLSNVQSVLIMVLLTGVFSFWLFSTTTDASVGTRLAGSLLVAALMGVIPVPVINASYATRIRNQILEIYGDVTTVPCSFKVTASALLIDQTGAVMKHVWQGMVATMDKRGDIVFRKPGWIAVVRRRAFKNQRAARAFLSSAQRQISTTKAKIQPTQRKVS